MCGENTFAARLCKKRRSRYFQKLVPVATEQNIEKLREYALPQSREIERLSRENAKLRGLPEMGQQAWLDEPMRDQLARLQRKFYGAGREELPGRSAGHEAEQLRIHGTRVMTETEKAAGNLAIFRFCGLGFYSFDRFLKHLNLPFKVRILD